MAGKLDQAVAKQMQRNSFTTLRDHGALCEQAEIGVAGRTRAQSGAVRQATAEAASSEAILLTRCEAYRQVGFSNRARYELTEFVSQYPESVPALDQLLHVLLAEGDEAGMSSLVQKVAEAQRPRALFYQARFYQSQRRWRSSWPDVSSRTFRCSPAVASMPFSPCRARCSRRRSCRACSRALLLARPHDLSRAAQGVGHGG